MKKLGILTLMIFCLTLCACSGGTTVTKTVKEEVTKVYTIEEDGTVRYEDLIPDEIELDGSTLSLSGVAEVEGDAPEETKKTTKTETEETDDLILIYLDEIKVFLDKYLVLVLAAATVLALGISALKKYRSRYDLWW